MWKDASRWVGSVAAIPAGFAMRTFQGLVGKRALLTLDVKPLPGARERHLLLHQLRRCATDPQVAGLLLRFSGTPGGWAASQDLRAAIVALRHAGKPVYAELDAPGNAVTWLASACDRVFIVPTGEVGLVGVGTELTFFGSLLETLGIEPDFEAAGAYKSFGEPFLRRYASPANHEAMTALIEDLHRQLIAGIASGRGIEEGSVRALVDRGPLSAQEALDGKLVDFLMYPDEIKQWLEEHHGGKVAFTEFDSWQRRDGALEWTETLGEGGPAIAILHLDGNIVMDDESGAVRIRAKHVVEQLAELRKDKDVKAVVLHINSGGGSALASDFIWREVDLLQRDKVVVACFEDVAASGGYYFAAPAAEILARPGTLTGSIGVFGGKLVVGNGLRKLGVHPQPIVAAPNAVMYSPSRRFTDDQRLRFRASLQRFYDGFVQRVAAGRKVDQAVIEPHCRGRVWTGIAALQHGLIDRHGDLFDAIERAAFLAKLTPGEFVEQHLDAQPDRPFLTKFIQRAMRQALPSQARLAARWLELPPTVELVLGHPEQALAMLPFQVEIR